MTSIIAVAAATFRSFFRGKRALVLENLALRQQLAVYKRVRKRPRLRSADRAFWVWRSRLWDGWKATHAIPAPYPELLERPPAGGKLIALPVLGGGQHDSRLAA